MPELVATVVTPAMVVLVAWLVPVQALLITARMAMAVPPVRQGTEVLVEPVVSATPAQRGLANLVRQVALAEQAVLVAMAHSGVLLAGPGPRPAPTALVATVVLAAMPAMEATEEQAPRVSMAALWV